MVTGNDINASAISSKDVKGLYFTDECQGKINKKSEKYFDVKIGAENESAVCQNVICYVWRIRV